MNVQKKLQSSTNGSYADKKCSVKTLIHLREKGVFHIVCVCVLKREREGRLPSSAALRPSIKFDALSRRIRRMIVLARAERKNSYATKSRNETKTDGCMKQEDAPPRSLDRVPSDEIIERDAHFFSSFCRYENV